MSTTFLCFFTKMRYYYTHHAPFSWVMWLLCPIRVQIHLLKNSSYRRDEITKRNQKFACILALKV